MLTVYIECLCFVAVFALWSVYFEIVVGGFGNLQEMHLLGEIKVKARVFLIQTGNKCQYLVTTILLQHNRHYIHVLLDST